MDEYDCYFLAPERTVSFVEKFICTFIPDYSQHQDEYVVPSGVERAEKVFPNPIDLVKYLCDHPNEPFIFYLSNDARPRKIYCAVFSFTADGNLILGYTHQVERGKEIQLNHLYREMLDSLGAKAGYQTSHDPPPSDEAEFWEKWEICEQEVEIQNMRPPEGFARRLWKWILGAK